MPKKAILRMPKVLESLGPGAFIISECRLRISDLGCTICLIFQSAIRNLKSAINLAPMLRFIKIKSAHVVLPSFG
jgi:hypothetical protein